MHLNVTHFQSPFQTSESYNGGDEDGDDGDEDGDDGDDGDDFDGYDGYDGYGLI